MCGYLDINSREELQPKAPEDTGTLQGLISCVEESDV
jgi:hypothetical protein